MTGMAVQEPHGIKAWVHRYLEAGRVRHDARTTLRSRLYHLQAFAAWCEIRDIHHPSEVSLALLETYQHWLFHYRKADGQTLKLETQLHRLVILRGFFQWLTQHGVLLHDPAATLQLPRKRHHLPSAVLKLQDVEKVMAQAPLDTPSGLRDRAIMETLFSTGIRRQELVGLKTTDLDLEGGTLWVRMGKGGTQRRVPIGNRAILWLEKYLLESRPVLARHATDEGWMFLNYKGQPLSMGSVTKRLGDYVRQAGIGKRGACHIFRHSVATLMLEGGADIRYIQELLGHRSLDTTQIYTRVSPTHLKDVHNRTHPAAKLTRASSNDFEGDGSHTRDP